MLVRSIALHFLAGVPLREGSSEVARDLYQEALGLARSAGRSFTATPLLFLLGRIAVLRGDHQSARQLMDEGMQTAQETGNPWMLAVGWSAFAFVSRAENRPARAQSYARQSILQLREIGDRWVLCLTLATMAAAFADEGRSEEALRIAGAAEAEADRSGSSLPLSLMQVTGAINRAKASLGQDAAESAYAAGRLMAIEDAIDYALEASRPNPEPTTPRTAKTQA